MTSEQHNTFGTYRGVMVIDAHRFSSHDDVQQHRLSTLIHEIVEGAARRADSEQLVTGSSFRAPRGDGVLYGFDPSLIPLVVDRFLDALQGELRRQARALRADGIRLRLRASLHIGPLPSFDPTVVDSPNGRTLTDCVRMNDSHQVRALLERSDPDATFLASAVSAAVMEDVIRAGQTARRPSEFARVQLKDEAKGYEGVGYLRVPVQSGDLLFHGLLGGAAGAEAVPSVEPDLPPSPAVIPNQTGGAPDPSSTANHIDTVKRATTWQSRDVGEIQNQHSAADRGGVVVNGTHNSVAGRDLDQSTGRQDFSGKFNFTGDGNFGSHSGNRAARADDQDDRA